MTPRLEIKGLSKFFPGVRALDDVSMSVEAGEILGAQEIFSATQRDRFAVGN